MTISDLNVLGVCEENGSLVITLHLQGTLYLKIEFIK